MVRRPFNVRTAFRRHAFREYKRFKGWDSISSRIADMSTEITINGLLTYSHLDTTGTHCSAIYWDLREPPGTGARRAPPPDRELSALELSDHATTPPLTVLTVECGVFPFSWPIEARNPFGVTVRDVLEAIHRVVHSRIKREEWDALSEKQRQRIGVVFDDRWRAAADPQATRSDGVHRLDCLLHATTFAGLSPSYGKTSTCILTLSRQRP